MSFSDMIYERSHCEVVDILFDSNLMETMEALLRQTIFLHLAKKLG